MIRILLMIVLACSPALLNAAPDCDVDRLAAAGSGEAPAAAYRNGMAALARDDFSGADRSFRAAYAGAGGLGSADDARTLAQASLARLVETAVQDAGGRPGAALTTAYFRLQTLRRLTGGHAAAPWIEQVMLAADQATVAVPEQGGTIATLARCRGFGVEPKADVRVLFDTDSSVVSADGRRQLESLAASLATVGVKEVEVIGHTDRHGSDAYNLSLSQRRAEAVVAVLLAMQPALSGRLVAKGKGRSALLYQGEGEKFDQLNRRVELVLADAG